MKAYEAIGGGLVAVPRSEYHDLVALAVAVQEFLRPSVGNPTGRERLLKMRLLDDAVRNLVTAHPNLAVGRWMEFATGEVFW